MRLSPYAKSLSLYAKSLCLLTILSSLALTGCSRTERSEQPLEFASIGLPVPVPSAPVPNLPVAQPSKVELQRARFDDLPSWKSDRADRALIAFKQSCKSLSAMPANKPIGKTTLGGTAGDWRAVCAKAKALPTDNGPLARRFFEQNFEPFRVGGRGTFTGYFEAVLPASPVRNAAYPVPVFAKPEQAATWMKNPTTGPTRAALENGAVDNLRPIYWLQDYADAFTLHVQGSGVLKLTDGRQVRVGYAANNGHKFGSIMPAMKAKGFDGSKGKTWQKMVGWLKDNPDVAQEVLESNPRFIFFEESNPRAATGAQGRPLTPGRSMAIDPAHIPLGVPLFIDTKMTYQGRVVPLQRLMVAQDTGGAIKGPVRGDVYWGTGEKALELAGKMKEPGVYFILLPSSGSDG